VLLAIVLSTRNGGLPVEGAYKSLRDLNTRHFVVPPAEAPGQVNAGAGDGRNSDAVPVIVTKADLDADACLLLSKTT
jgi:hypothetical protein